MNALEFIKVNDLVLEATKHSNSIITFKHTESKTKFMIDKHGLKVTTYNNYDEPIKSWLYEWTEKKEEKRKSNHRARKLALRK